MGGGDLNLKKSWHPSTLRNIERVWKAEQKHEVEKQKIEQLQRELAEERAREEIQAYAEDQGVVKKKEERLDWMYQGPAAMINRDDYLLGRKIDKVLESLDQQQNGKEPERDDFDVGATMFSSQDLSGTATVDLANKIREDPLFSIMKKEKEQRKNLLSNPVKMKQLQQLLKESLTPHKHKKSKKKKKKHSDSDSDEEKRYKKHKEKHSKNYHSDSDSDEEKRYKKHKEKHSKNYHSEYDSPKASRKQSSNDIHSKNNKSYVKKFERKEPSDCRNESVSNYSRGRDSSHASKYKSDLSYDGHFPRESYGSGKSSNSKPRERLSDMRFKRKLNADERAEQLREMQQNAKWREEQRERKVKCYKDEEEQEARTSKMNTSDFIKPLLTKAAGNGSLENRVKQKIFSIQRNSAEMDKHFARR